MDVNGENMDRRWQREIHVQELIIVAQWELLVQFGSKYIQSLYFCEIFLSSMLRLN
jgi:hypothetical protein